MKPSTLIARDIYVKRTDPTGHKKPVVTQHRVWEADLFVAAQVAQHDGDVLGGEGVLNHFLEYVRHGGHVGRGFQHKAVYHSEEGDDRAQAQGQRGKGRNEKARTAPQGAAGLDEFNQYLAHGGL